MTERTPDNTPLPEEESLSKVPDTSGNAESSTTQKESGVENTTIPPFLGKKREHFGFELLKIVVLAIIIVTPIRVFIAQPFIVSGASMDETFRDGQYLIVDQLTYRFNEPERGDVIIFRFPLEPSKFFIKRIIGLPHDQVILQGNAVIIINAENPEGLVLDEWYLSPENRKNGPSSTTLAAGEYFVMGDNRRESSDSRTWGSLNEELIIGRALVRLFPVSSFKILPGI